ncbi:hypothetical protein J3A83DRAFT_2553482 [Scleroderma citrinum]
MLLGCSSSGTTGMHMHPQATTARPSHQRGSRNFWVHQQYSRSKSQAGHGRHPSSTAQQPHPSTQYHSRNNPFQNPHVQRATGWRTTESDGLASNAASYAQGGAGSGMGSWSSRDSSGGSGLYGAHANSDKERGGEPPVTQNYLGAMGVLTRVGGLAMLCSFSLYIAGILSNR